MPTRIAEYYNELQRREGLEPVELVAQWEQHDIEAISAAFRSAFAESRITEQTIPIRDRSTNQSIGNQVADFFVPQLTSNYNSFGLMRVLVAVIRIKFLSKLLHAGRSHSN